MQLPLGISDFKELVDYRSPNGEKYVFVDKSLFIKDILDDPAKAILITRPRRFGKTLNMSMLYYFLVNTDNSYLFEKLKIAACPQHMNYQGKYPVICLTFKDIKSDSFVAAYTKIFEMLPIAFQGKQLAVAHKLNLI